MRPCLKRKERGKEKKGRREGGKEGRKEGIYKGLLSKKCVCVRAHAHVRACEAQRSDSCVMTQRIPLLVCF